MSLLQGLRSARVSWLLFATIIAVWLLVALSLGQSVLSVQRSRHLLQFGAVDGALLEAGEWWRLPVSQFLHVHAPHMFFNAIAVLVVGSFIEARMGRWWIVAVYFLGGCVGQFASVAFYPALVSSGASQALMAICGVALLMCRTRVVYLFVIPILAIQLALDVKAVGTLKAGHGWGLAAGVLLGVIAMLLSKRMVNART
jgi:rhomboid protease GluP